MKKLIQYLTWNDNLFGLLEFIQDSLFLKIIKIKTPQADSVLFPLYGIITVLLSLFIKLQL